MSIDLRELAADLREARRYVRNHPVTAGEMAVRAVARINVFTWGPARYEREALCRALGRLTSNVSVGIKYVRSQPELLSCYLACAAAELDILAGPIEVFEVAEVPV